MPSTNLRYATLDSSKPVPATLISQLDSAFEANRAIFRRRPPRFRVVICHSDEEWRRASAYYYFPFARGVVLRDGTMVVKSPGMTRFSISAYSKLLRHEMNHVFWVKLFKRPGRLWSPFWICEGLACIAGESPFLLDRAGTIRLIKRHGWDEQILLYSYRAKCLGSRREIAALYSTWYHLLLHLAGKDTGKIVRLLSEDRRHGGARDFDHLFRKVFGRGKREAFEELLAG